MRVRFTQRAARQLDRILSELKSVNPNAARALQRRVDEIVRDIGLFPDQFQQVGERPGVQRAPMIRFPYLMFYKIVNEEAVVLRIRHDARKEPWENL